MIVTDGVHVTYASVVRVTLFVRRSTLCNAVAPAGGVVETVTAIVAPAGGFTAPKVTVPVAPLTGGTAEVAGVDVTGSDAGFDGAGDAVGVGAGVAGDSGATDVMPPPLHAVTATEQSKVNPSERRAIT
ncbi:MAG: hypothetical protein M3169_03345 [Candidatus Eremiobacteraeota bacterium]|nr:hypothetical protein [Candidatus Eremiobacteraeota bacterium]